MLSSFLQKCREKTRIFLAVLQPRGVSATVSNEPPSLDDDMAWLDEMAWLDPPCDVHNSAAWDRYWEDQVAHGLGPPLFDMFCHDAPLIQLLNERGAKTVLCAGNGMSQEPRALAAAGFHVTAMDLSPKAVDLAGRWRFTPKELDRFCAEEQRVPGGTVSFVVGDILDGSVCPGPFDAIIERCMLQLFPKEERGAALDALASRLQSGGLFLSHCHDGGWRPGRKRVHHVEQFFLDRGWPIIRNRSTNCSGRVAWLEISTG